MCYFLFISKTLIHVSMALRFFSLILSKTDFVLFSNFILFLHICVSTQKGGEEEKDGQSGKESVLRCCVCTLQLAADVCVSVNGYKEMIDEEISLIRGQDLSLQDHY